MSDQLTADRRAAGHGASSPRQAYDPVDASAPDAARSGGAAAEGIAAQSRLSRRRIVVLCSVGSRGGAAMASLRLAKGLSERGHDVSAHYLYQRGAIDRPDYPFDVLSPAAAPSAGDYAGITRGVFRLLSERRPDSVVTFLPLASCIGQFAARAVGVPSRVVSHRVPFTTYGRAMRLADRSAAWSGLYTHVVAVSEGVRASLDAYPGRMLRRTSVVHNGLLNFQRSTLSMTDARARHGLARQADVLLALGRLEPQKNLAFLVRLMTKLPRAVLLLAGEGGERAALEALVRDLGLGDRVRLLGSVARADVPDLLAAADLFVQPSLFEGQSNAVLEALGAGLPVVANDIPEQRETIAGPEGVAGALPPVGDGPAWIAAIARLTQDAHAREAARSLADRRGRLFTFDRMIDGFETAIGA